MELDSTQVDELIAAGRLFHARGWVPATGGNFSFRADARRVAITASGCHKGELSGADLMVVDLDGRPEDPDRKASAETPLHCQLYRKHADVAAVLHTHSIASTVLSRTRDKVALEGYELLKVLDGIETHETVVELPVFENDQDIARLSARVEAAMKRGGARHAYLIRGHGLYVWGPSVAVARHRAEALEFLLQCELEDRR